MHGFGTMSFATGDIYTGEWVKNKMHGKGSWFDAVTGKTLEAVWEQGQRISVHGIRFPEGKSTPSADSFH